MVLGVSDLNYDSYGGFRTNLGYEPKDVMYSPVFGRGIRPFTPPKKKEKVGFWEGTKAFFKGLIKPIKNMLKHPIKSALFIAASVGLVAITGGAALPLLIGCGFVIGGYKVAKGTYNAITADTREGTLAGLEDMGEGTFTVGASVAGAKAYASSTSAGSATAAAAKEATLSGKIVAYSKGLYSDSVTTIKAIPESANSTFAQIVSGKAAINAQSAISSAKLAKQKAEIVEAFKAGDKAKAHELLATYRQDLAASKAALNAKRSAMFDRCNALSDKFGTERYNNLIAETFKNGFKNYSTTGALKSSVNPLNNLPQENIAIGVGSGFANDICDDEIEESLNTYGPAFGLTA